MRELKKPNFVKNKKLVRTTTFLAVLLIATTLLLSGSVTSISISSESTNLNANAKPITGNIRELSPNIKTGLKVQPESSRAIWDIQFWYDVQIASGDLGNAGAEWDGTYFYTNRWASNLIHKYNSDGTLVGAYTIAGVSGLRDLAFDGTYFWGGNGGTTLWKMDFSSWTLLETFTGTFSVRAIAYNDDLDVIYASPWADPVYIIDPSDGSILGTFNLGTTTSTYGFAYDGLTAGGPFLWVYDQTGSPSSDMIYQWDLAAGAYTGVSHDVTGDFTNAGIAGGLFFADDFVPGFSTLGGLSQGTPDILFCYEIAMTTAPEHDVELKSIDAPSSGPAQGSFTPKVTIRNNGNNSESLSVNMKINTFTTPTDYWCDGFESGTPGGWAFPSGWTIETTNPTGTWYLYTSSTSYSASVYPRIQESGSDGNAQDESLISPSIDCSALSTVALRIAYFYFYAYSPDYAQLYINVSNNGGSTWNNVALYTSSTTGNRYIDVSTYAAGYSNVMFKFNFVSPADTTLSSYCYFDKLWVGEPASWGPLGDNPPPGMDIQNYPTNPTTWNYNYWYNYSYTYTSYDNIGPAARYYYTSPYEDVDCALITPSIDCTDLDTVKVYINGYFYFYSGYTHGIIEYSIDGGTNWLEAYNFLATRYCYEFDGYNDFDLPLAAHENNVKVRFRYWHTVAEVGRYWYIGNIRVGSDRNNIIYYDSMQGTTAYSTNFKVVMPDIWVDWAWEQVSGTSATNQWLLVNTGTLPTCSPYSGTQMAEYNSYNAPSGEKARLYNLNPISVGTANSLRVKFMMYHYSSGADQIQVQYNDGVSGWQDAGATIPLMGDPGWALEEVVIPSVPTSGQIQIGFLGISAYGYNIFIDDVCIYDPGMVTEFTDSKTVGINVGETKQVDFSNWIPDAWHTQQNVIIIYPITAWIELTGDQIPSNDLKDKEITLSYPFFHDIAVMSVDSPTEDGPAQTLPVGCTIKNVGQYDECCYQTQMKIGAIGLGSVVLEEDFSVNDWTVTNSKWSKVSSANAGGTAPEYRFYYSPSETGTFLLYSPPINTVGAAAAQLSWKHMVNHYTTPYTLAVMTSTDATNWETVWSIDPTGSVPATTEEITVSSGIGSSTFYIAFAFIGYSYNINYWYVDDVKLQAIEFVAEYTDTVCTIELEPGESAELEFDDWTPADLALGISGDIGYIAQAEQMLLTDTNPDNDVASSSFTLSYWHDVKVKEITDPSIGRGDVIFSQRPYLPTESWTFRTSSAGGGYLCQDNFWDLTDTIGDIEFYGLCLIYSAGWTPGNPNTLPFEVTFYEDGGSAPGPVVDTFTLPAITPVNTGLSYSGYIMYYWAYDLPTSIGLADGWISIQSTTAPDNAWLLWAGSPEGDLNMWQQGASPPQIVGDCAFNLSKGGAPGPVDVTVWVPLNADEEIAGIVQNLGTFGENDLTCYAEIYEYITNESGVQIYSDSVSDIDLNPLGDEETVIFKNHVFDLQGTYNLILNIPLPADNDDFPANNVKKLGIGCDNTKPVSTHTLNPATPDGLNGWYVSDLTVTIDANDGTEEWQSGVKEIAYKIGSEPIKTIPGAYGSFKVEDDGEDIVVEYWAIDKVGNEESHHTFTVDMDQTTPTISMTYEAVGNPTTGYTFTFTATAIDDPSGMERVEFYFNNVLQETVTGGGPTYQWIIEYNPIPNAVVKATAYDIAGNSASDEIENPDPRPHNNEQSLPNSVNTVKINLGR